MEEHECTSWDHTKSTWSREWEAVCGYRRKGYRHLKCLLWEKGYTSQWTTQ